MKAWVLILSLFFSINIFGQSRTDTAKNIIYLGIGRQEELYLKYERLVYYKKWTQTIVNTGLGWLQGDHEPPDDIPSKNSITIELGQLFGYKLVFLEMGIEPSFNFYGNLAYTNINAIFGLRYQSWTKGLFFQVGYNPRLYYTYMNDSSIPFYLGFGWNF